MKTTDDLYWFSHNYRTAMGVLPHRDQRAQLTLIFLRNCSMNFITFKDQYIEGVYYS